MVTSHDRTKAFRDLHTSGIFIMPNPWDVGSARLLASLGFPALATTSSGHAATLGRRDQHVTRDELLAHASAIAAAVDVPLNVDAERCFAVDLPGVEKTVQLVARTGASGCSIEDYDPSTGRIDDLPMAVERVAAAAQAAHQSGLVLTARTERHLYGAHDLDTTIARLLAYRDAGADVLYAPGLTDIEDIARVVRETSTPVNVLALPRGPSVPQLASVGVRRVSTGGALARAAYGAALKGARELLRRGTSTYTKGGLPDADLLTAFD